MARPLRLEFPGALYHITSRGNSRQHIFLSDKDKNGFCKILEEVVSDFNWLCHAYCLMQNHYHLIIETIDANLSQGMRQLNGMYTQSFNRFNRKVGHVFQGRYKSIVVERETYLLELCRYVVLNPVRAEAVNHPKDYRWSSYCSTAGLAEKPPFLTTDWILSCFSDNHLEAQEIYRDFVLSGIRMDCPWDDLVGGCILGGKAFSDSLSEALADKTEITEVPRRERFASRPPLATLFLRAKSKEDRNCAMVTAFKTYGYTFSEIGRHLGLHYSTISKIIEKKVIE